MSANRTKTTRVGADPYGKPDFQPTTAYHWNHREAAMTRAELEGRPPWAGRLGDKLVTAETLDEVATLLGVA